MAATVFSNGTIVTPTFMNTLYSTGGGHLHDGQNADGHAPIIYGTKTVTTNTTGGSTNLSANTIFGGILIQNVSGASTLTLPSASSLLSLVANAVIGTSIKFTVKNFNNSSSVGLVASGSMTNGGVTQDFTIGANTNATFEIVFTNVTSPAAVLYRTN
jgi:hypothetical protein